MSLFASLLLAYVACAFALYMAQKGFLYHPAKFETYDKAALQKEGVLVAAKDGLEWLVIPAADHKKVLVYFHGNGGAAVDRIGKMRVWAENGYNVVLAEYPGYGTNGGIAGEDSFYEAGRMIIDQTLAVFPYADLYIYGESIGSGTAVQMATEYNEKALLIEAGFSSLVELASLRMPFFPVSVLLKDRFENADKINRIDSFLLSVHGTADRVVPFKFGKKLYDAYDGPKDMVIIDGADHNDIYTKTDMARIIRELE